MCAMTESQVQGSLWSVVPLLPSGHLGPDVEVGGVPVTPVKAEASVLSVLSRCSEAWALG